MGRGFNSARLRRQKRRLQPRAQKPRRQAEVSGHRGASPSSGPGSAPPEAALRLLCLLYCPRLRLAPLPTPPPALSCFWLSGLPRTPSAPPRSLPIALHSLQSHCPISASAPLSRPHSSCSSRTMNCAGAWQPGEPSGRPGRWSWRGTWRPLGLSSGSSVPSSRTAAGSGLGPSANSANRTSGSASSWPRWDDPDPGSLGKEGADALSWWGWARWAQSWWGWLRWPRLDGPDPGSPSKEGWTSGDGSAGPVAVWAS